jgi:hypothetical protein
MPHSIRACAQLILLVYSVAIFDAVYLPTKRNPILLLQPTPKLSDLSSAATSSDMDVPDVTFVGRIGDSLFALSHINYPLVVFTPIGKKHLPRIDDGGKTPPAGEADAERCYDLDCFVGTRWSQSAARSGLSRLLEEAHTLGIEGSVGVEDPPEGGAFPEQAVSESRSRSPKTSTLNAPRPTTTTNNDSSHSVPSSVPDEPEFTILPPKATPSHRAFLRALAREWIAAWAGMGTVLISTLVFGVGLVSKGKAGVWRGKQEDKTEVQQTQSDGEKEEDDDTPPPVPPKPASFSLSKMTGSPYLITEDSRPKPPPKEPFMTMPRPKRPRNRGSGLPSSTSVPVLPVLNPVEETATSKSTVDVRIVDEPEETEAEPEAEPGTPGKKRVRRGRRGKGRGKGKSKEEDVGSGDAADEGVPAIAGALSEGSESFVKVDKAALAAKSSLMVTEDVLGELYIFSWLGYMAYSVCVGLGLTERLSTRDDSRAGPSPLSGCCTTL